MTFSSRRFRLPVSLPCPRKVVTLFLSFRPPARGCQEGRLGRAYLWSTKGFFPVVPYALACLGRSHDGPRKVTKGLDGAEGGLGRRRALPGRTGSWLHSVTSGARAFDAPSHPSCFCSPTPALVQHDGLDFDVEPNASTVGANEDFGANARERSMRTAGSFPAGDAHCTEPDVRIGTKDSRDPFCFAIRDASPLGHEGQEHAGGPIIGETFRLSAHGALAHHIGAIQELPPTVVRALDEIHRPVADQGESMDLGETRTRRSLGHAGIVCRRV
jgi:hypothetical protein